MTAGNFTERQCLRLAAPPSEDQGGPGLMAPGRLRPAGGGGGCEGRGEEAALPGHQPRPPCTVSRRLQGG